MENYTIYQIADIRRNNYGFTHWRYANNKFSFEDYKEVYAGKIDRQVGMSDESILELVFLKFNADEKPEDYEGHSLSVSDIVKIGGKYYYCDSFGWEDITSHI